ncbi:MAG: transcriptional regulator [SAR86 cluster bacterium]|uniref:Transcriptional regulator n=1 Tax=SAR86 cluster bacterium TaxID=2030880 RepID=A0A2A5C7F7_9GAMM|nr:MAG: transcriptional regulator [SAR86 cluster bacterium]
MDKFERIYELHKLLTSRRAPVSRVEIENKLDCSKSTATRLIEFCRSRIQIPIEYDRERSGYYLAIKEGEHYELPGLWFNPSELIALMTSHRLIADVQPGVLEPFLAPLQKRIESLLEDEYAGNQEVFKRIRILQMAPRVAELEDFQQITDALIGRVQIRIQYGSRGKQELTERWVSPQRLIYYRDNWYLDAWCHLRKAIRTFSLDRMNVAEKGQIAKDITDKQLDAHFTRTYGIFAGPATNKAVIHFSDKAAEWIADEHWHPEQESKRLENGNWELTVPYGDSRELIMDILKYGEDAEVIEPESLRQQVIEKMQKSLKNYKKL